jgi:hypothetical protein
MAGINERTGRRRHRAAAILRVDGRLAADAALLRPLGDRAVLEFNHAHTVMVEHMFTVAEGGVRGNLDLLKLFATKLPDLRFAGLLAWIPAVSARRGRSLAAAACHMTTSTPPRPRTPSPQARSPGKVHTRADASIVRRPARGFRGSAYERETGITIARSALLPVDIRCAVPA